DRIDKLERRAERTLAENSRRDGVVFKFKNEVEKLRHNIDELKKESESKKNHKFQTRCIQIAKEILNEEPMIKYCPPFLNGLELDAFFQKY
ncbi:hypothetical protein RhiirA5_445534, partial [Rhizophagus irregularis]